MVLMFGSCNLHIVLFQIISIIDKETSSYKYVTKKLRPVFLFFQNIYSWNFIWSCISLSFLHFVYLFRWTAFGRYSRKSNPLVDYCFEITCSDFAKSLCLCRVPVKERRICILRLLWTFFCPCWFFFKCPDLSEKQKMPVQWLSVLTLIFCFSYETGSSERFSLLFDRLTFQNFFLLFCLQEVTHLMIALICRTVYLFKYCIRPFSEFKECFTITISFEIQKCLSKFPVFSLCGPGVIIIHVSVCNIMLNLRI